MGPSSRGYLYALCAAILGGTIPVVSKLLVGVASPAVASGTAFLIAGFILFPYKPKAYPKGNNAWLILGVALTGSTLAPILYLIGVSQSSAVNAALLTNSEVFFTAVIGIGLFKESMKRTQLLEGLLIAAGILLISLDIESGGVSLAEGATGNLLILLAAVFWSIDNNLSRVVSQRVGVSMVAKYKALIGGSLTIAFLLVFASVAIEAVAVPLLIILGSTFALTTLLSVGALRLIGAVRTLLVFSTSAFFGPLFAFLILREEITIIQLAGGALILLGVFLIQKSDTPKAKSGTMNSDDGSSSLEDHGDPLRG